MGKNLEKFMWEVMKHLGQGTLSLREDGAVIYDAPCRCGDPLCGDKLILNPTKDQLIWTRSWGQTYHYDEWSFTEDGDIEYLGSVQDEGFRYPPVVPE
jgi:hypothetical protein